MHKFFSIAHNSSVVVVVAFDDVNVCVCAYPCATVDLCMSYTWEKTVCLACVGKVVEENIILRESWKLVSITSLIMLLLRREM